MRGISDASGVDYKSVLRLNMFPELTKVAAPLVVRDGAINFANAISNILNHHVVIAKQTQDDARSRAPATPFLSLCLEQNVDDQCLSDTLCFPPSCIRLVFPFSSQASCSFVGAWGPATAAGKVLQVRALDFDMDGPFKDFAQVCVCVCAG